LSDDMLAWCHIRVDTKKGKDAKIMISISQHDTKVEWISWT